MNNATEQTGHLLRQRRFLPLFVTQLGYNIANLSSGTSNKRLLASTYAFRVEPP
mgnify:CR=1 FL=1